MGPETLKKVLEKLATSDRRDADGQARGREQMRATSGLCESEKGFAATRAQLSSLQRLGSTGRAP